MSTYSEAWHNTPPHIRDFYRNWAFRHTALLNRWWTGEEPFPYEYFNMVVSYWWRPLGRDVAYSNWMWHLAEWGQFFPEHVEFSDDFTWHWQGSRPVRGVTNYPTWWDQYIDIPYFAINYPREKRNVPRCYWTGQPRKRMNL